MSAVDFMKSKSAFWVLVFTLGFLLGFFIPKSLAKETNELEPEIEEVVAVVEKKEKNKEEKKQGEVKTEVSPEMEKVDSEFGISTSLYTKKSSKIKSGQFFSTLMTDIGLSQNEIHALTQKAKGVFDMRQVKVGYTYHTFHTKGDSSKLAYLVYEKDNESYVVFNAKDSISVEVRDKEFEISVEYADVTINSSLWLDITNAGVSPILALRLSEIYAWTIDFFGLQKGDSFKAVYETKSYQGEVIGVNRVLYANFVHLKKEHRAYYFKEEGSENEYWNEKGESTRKAFLKSPLNFSRVSSGFTYARRHPITRKVRPHTGIDYAAPMGTPIWSIGDGVVVEKKYTRAGGHQVTIKHNSVYRSAYLHLSKYGRGIKVGQRVKQKQIIGYVGSTGYSTGPHLDFRIWRNGTPINPLKMKSPPAFPVKKKNMGDFQMAKTNALLSLDRAYATVVLEEKINLL